MQAFHNDPKEKQFYVDRLAEHHKHDQIIQGVRFDGVRGCNVGCVLHKYDHSAYPEELELPEWYAYLCEMIFEGLPKDKAPAFAMASISAILPGVDVEPVRWQLAILRHKKQLVRLKDNNEDYAVKVKSVLQSVIHFCEDTLNNVTTDDQAESAARLTWTPRLAEESAWAAWTARLASKYLGTQSATTAENEFIWEAETLIKLLTEIK